MKSNVKTIVGYAAPFLLVAACAFALPTLALGEVQEEETPEVESVDAQVFYPVYVREGYDSMIEWKKDVQEYSDTVVTKGQEILDNYTDYFSDEEKAQLQEVINKAEISGCFTRLNEYSAAFDLWQTKGEENKVAAEEAAKKAEEEAAAAAAKATKSSSSNSSSGSSNSANYVSNGSGLTKSSGVNYYDGRKETYYSSRVLHHYRTSEWTLDSEGFYRTSEGYYVVATSDKAAGSTFQGSKGTCISLDTGCAAGTTDYYVGW